jgi:putative hydrolase of the HAD superfamily
MTDALIFDLDDTLVADEISAATAFHKTCLFAQAHYGRNLVGFYDTVREVCRSYWYQSPARAYCVEVGISSWEGLWAEFTGEDENLRILRDWAPTYRKLTWTTVLQKYGILDEAFALKLAEIYIQRRGELHLVYGDVKPTLETLKSHYHLGLLTNGAPDLQRRKIEGAGLSQYFDAIVVSGEVGIGKPDGRVFDMVLSRLAAKPGAAIMIGDSLKSDIQGAHLIGMKAVWMNRQGKPPEELFVPDYEVPDLMELLPAIEQGII